jgi:hypothetical protein
MQTAPRCSHLLPPAAALGAIALVFAACVPIPQTATLAPAIDGSLKRQDGAPLVGERLALSVAYEDSTCLTPALLTNVDSAGGFAFPAVTKRERWTPVLFDRVLCYSICGGQGGDPVHQACYLHAVPTAVTLPCVVYDPPTAPAERRTVCLAARRPGR